ncbi:MAG TPA: hypothetical protein DCY31_06405 [Ruminococcaceae bacterium]|mgnify:CR=1 FL=1|nr:hypothetical protein [Oscillospiraceae bacterium]
MTVDEIKAKVNDIFANSYSAQVYLVLKTDSGFELRIADIEDETEPELRTMFSENVSYRISSNEDLSVCNLSVADDRANALFYYDYEEYPEELAVFKDFDLTSAVNEISKFNFNSDNISSLYGYVVYLGSMTDGLLLFKKHYPISLIKRECFLLGLHKSKERFEKISSDDILRLNGDFQLIRFGDEIYVTDVKVLERNLGFNALVFREASSTVGAIDELKLLEDIQVLKDSAEEITFARKLSKVKKTSPIFANKIPKEVIVEFTKNNPGLKGAFKYSEDGQTIRLDTKKSKEAFVKLLNDAFLRSELTKEYYEARAKDNITNV